MLIKFRAEELVLEDQPVTLAGQNINDIFIPTFEVRYLARDEEYIYGKLYGDIVAFTALNTIDTNYFEIVDVPVDAEYFTDPKFNHPKNVNDALKLQMRTKIEDEIGDNEDLISDLFKRLTMLERLVIRLTDDLLTSDPGLIPYVSSEYAGFVINYLNMNDICAGVTSISDLEDPNELFAKLFERSIRTTEIVKSNYLDKKV